MKDPKWVEDQEELKVRQIFINRRIDNFSDDFVYDDSVIKSSIAQKAYKDSTYTQGDSKSSKKPKKASVVKNGSKS